MKRCQYCAEEIQDDAIKCKHCGEFIDLLTRSESKKPWYFGTGFILAMFCCVGPLALPLVWRHPEWHYIRKIILTIVVMVVSWMLYLMMQESLQYMEEYYQFLNELQ